MEKIKNRGNIEERLARLERQFQNPKLMGTIAAARYCGLSRSNFLRIVATGEIAYLQRLAGKKGSKLYFNKNDLDNFLKNRKKFSIRGLLEGIEQKL
jgi:hypothetical protein